MKEEMIMDLVYFAKDKLIPRHDVYIDLVFDTAIEYGFCEVMDNDYRPREFQITLNPLLKPEDMLVTVMHEMVHVKQFVRGELKMTYKPHRKVMWLGKELKDVHYAELPYELEAYAMEKKLAEMWLEAKGA